MNLSVPLRHDRGYFLVIRMTPSGHKVSVTSRGSLRDGRTNNTPVRIDPAPFSAMLETSGGRSGDIRWLDWSVGCSVLAKSHTVF